MADNPWRSEGGPAYPGESSDGMTLRDYFAGHALTGFLAAPDSVGDDARQNPNVAAEWAYEMADAMLAARKAGA